MSEIRTKHRNAMALLDEANGARMQGNHEHSCVLQQQAFRAEREAAELLAETPEQEPTRSILFRSAATLALDCGEYAEAERLTSLGLMGNPPEAIAQELRAVQMRARQQQNPAPNARVASI